ncbi:YcdB/YcdC domain-containing protein [Sporosarcina sp. Te-1]|uniref:YcdB/YcdC domain-containing protein n=1 Tax=Sporosarcina sp. Te-1 TaxID=2818390 RepID=UPI001A9F057A|nr:YcdB/YcdC domain-containing protein [Sporosarcina sp. Te-1]QTD43081.1 S-layer homology domain-containing protein [Sporosarcina sp. Te-1]
MKFKKFGMALSSSALAFGMLTSAVAAQENPIGQTAETTSVAQTVTKQELITKFKTLFPELEFLAGGESYMSSGSSFIGDEKKRFNLTLHGKKAGKEYYANVGFAGDELDLESYSYSSPNAAEALFPPKVSNDEAKEIAKSFVKKLLDEKDYQLEESPYYYYNMKLTEPVRYSFTFKQLKGQVPVSDQNVQVTVLGNGEVVEYYTMSNQSKDLTYDETEGSLDKEKVLNQIKENLAVDLQYEVSWDFRTGERTLGLVYTPRIANVHALTGKWETIKGFGDAPPATSKVERIVTEPLTPRNADMTPDEAKKIAEQILKAPDAKGKLSIQGIDERTNYNGNEVISVHYMYETGNGGYGSNLEFDRKTGDLLNYYQLRDYNWSMEEEKKDWSHAISEQEALEVAIGYLKEFMPSKLHLYSKPSMETQFDERIGTYHFSFPRVEKGITVIGDQLYVAINADGTLSSISSDYSEFDVWPDPDKAVAAEEALAKYKESLSVDLNYMRKGESKHYDLVYAPKFNSEFYGTIDALTGEWKQVYGTRSDVTVSHPSAEKELNYLISANILEVKDGKTFNGDAAVSRGEALRVIMSSLTYFYDTRFSRQEELKQTFDNIDPKHPLYPAIEHAVSIGLISADQSEFDVDAPMTREELAVWYVKVLGLEKAAEHTDLYKVDFEDKDKITKEFAGYVAIANAKGLLKAEGNQFNPKAEVSYADLAISTIRLAHQLADRNVRMFY